MLATDHPILARVKEAFPEVRFLASTFRGQATLVVPPADAHRVLRFLHDDPACAFDFLSDVTAVDYLDYPAPQPGRFAVVWVLSSTTGNARIVVKAYVDPTLDTTGNAADPALEVDTVTDIWPGAEWREREAFDMYGIRFRNHPDLRRILLWESYPAFPLRKDYPLRGRGERETYRVVERDDA